LLAKLVDYVKGGGNLVLSFKSGFCKEYSTFVGRWRWAFARRGGFCTIRSFSSLLRPLALKDDPFQVGAEYRVSDWAEMLILDTAKPLAYYDHPFFATIQPLLTMLLVKGTLTYEGTVLSDKLQQSVLLDVLKQAGLTGPDQELPVPVRVKHGFEPRGQDAPLLLELLERSTETHLRVSFRNGLLSQATIAMVSK